MDLTLSRLEKPVERRFSEYCYLFILCLLLGLSWPSYTGLTSMKNSSMNMCIFSFWYFISATTIQ